MWKFHLGPKKDFLRILTISVLILHDDMIICIYCTRIIDVFIKTNKKKHFTLSVVSFIIKKNQFNYGLPEKSQKGYCRVFLYARIYTIFERDFFFV